MKTDIEHLGSTEENLQWFTDNFTKIQEEFSGKVVAIKDKEIIINANNGMRILELLKNKGIDDSEVIIEKIYPKDEIRILK